MTSRTGKHVRILPNNMHPDLAGRVGVIIWRRAQKFVRVRLDDHTQPLGPNGKGWFLPASKVQPC
jgi:hypothetical protein